MTPDQPPTSAFDELIGTTLVEASPDRVVATVEVTPHLHQPYGIVHGGVYASVIETLASIGAALHAMKGGGTGAVGLSNHTDFLRAVRDGVLTFTATPAQQGRSTQLWLVDVTDGDDRLVATGRVRLFNLRDDSPVEVPPQPHTTADGTADVEALG